MTTSAQNVSHDHGITRELYEVSREYAETLKRLRAAGTDESAISLDFYRAALKMYAVTLSDPRILAGVRDDQVLESLYGLATIALRWARAIRTGPPLQMSDQAVKEGELVRDTTHGRYDARRLPCSDC